MHAIVLATSKRAKKPRCYYLNVQLANEQKKKRCYYLNVFFYIHTIVLTTSKRAKKSYYYLNIYLFQQLAKSK